MARITLWLLSIALCAAAAPHSPAQAPGPGLAITEATWAQYREHYPHSPLCVEDEATLWACTTGKRAFALCSSQRVTRTSGYMQYRASRAGKTEFHYPQTRRPPLGLFVFNAFPNGDASVEFSNDGYRYSLVDPLRSSASILISAPGASGTTEIDCQANQTLQMNYTMRLMYESGVWQRDPAAF